LSNDEPFKGKFSFLLARQLGGTVYGGGGGSGSIWSPAVTESGGGFPGDHQRLAWTTTASQQQCYQNYSSYYTNMDYLSPAPHQLNVVVGMRHHHESCRE
jgi:homeobox protein OTX2